MNELVGSVSCIGGVWVKKGEVDIENVTVKIGGIQVYKHVLVGMAGDGKVLWGEVVEGRAEGVCYGGVGDIGVGNGSGEPSFDASCAVGGLAGKNDEVVCAVFGG